MISVYSEGNNKYTKNGDITLIPYEAYTECELNGTWTATLAHPIDPEGRWKYLTEQAVVKMPSWNGEQLYRISNRTTSDTDVVCTMYPIFYDSMGDCFLEDVRPTNKNGQDALDIMLAANSKYSAESNITKKSTAYYEYVNFMEALNGDAENNFLTRWGGEIEFDNYLVKVKTRLGKDNGLELRYGKNIQEINEDIDMTEVVTRIYPKAFNGRKKTTGTPYVSSPLKDAYPTIKAATITFDNIKLKADASPDDLTNPDIVICRSQSALNDALIVACHEQFDAGLDKPNVNISISGLIELSKLEEYKQFQQDVGLGDTVHLIHPKLDIVTDARIIYMRYDSIREQADEIQIGRFQYDYFKASYAAVNKINTVVRQNGTVKADVISGQIDMKMANLYAQYDSAARSDVLGILFENNDPTSDMYGAMALGTQGFMISDQKGTDGDWIWTTIGTSKGLVANAIIAGILRSKNGLSYWDLDNDEFVFHDESESAEIVLKDGVISFLHNGIRYGLLKRMGVSAGDLLALASQNGVCLRKDATNQFYITSTGAVLQTDEQIVTTAKKIIQLSSDTVVNVMGANESMLASGENNRVRVRNADGIWVTASDLHFNGYDIQTSDGRLMAYADADGNVFPDTYVKWRQTITQLNADLNTGFYTYAGGATGAPSSAGGSLLNIRYSSTYEYQLAFPNSSQGIIKIYVRMAHGNTFTAWTALI